MKQSVKLMGMAGLAFMLAATSGCNKAEEDVTPGLSQSAVNNARSLNRAAGVATNVRLMSDQYIIISRTNDIPADLSSKLAAMKGTITKKIDQAGIAAVRSSDPNFISKASRIAGVRSVIRDAKIQWYNPEQEKVVKFEAASFGNPPASGDNDPYFDLQWGHDAMDVVEAWNNCERGKGARVAVLDGGFDLDHPDLAPNIDMGASKNFVPGEALQYGLNNTFSHGSHVAGIVAAADNGFGVIGVAPKAELILVKVLGDGGSGQFSWMMSGIEHAVSKGADVINMSLSGTFPRDGKYMDENGNIIDESYAVSELVYAINRVTTMAHRAGTTIIASAGNSGISLREQAETIVMPAEAQHVISISATSPRGWALSPFTAFLDYPATYTSYGYLAASGGDSAYPGNEIVQIGPIVQYAYVFDLVFSTGNNGWYWSAGTSMAAPYAAGVAALVIGKNGGSMNPLAVKGTLLMTADDLGRRGDDEIYGGGRINAHKAVKGNFLFTNL